MDYTTPTLDSHGGEKLPPEPQPRREPQAPPFTQIAVTAFPLVTPDGDVILDKLIVGLDHEGGVWEFNDVQSSKGQGWYPLTHRRIWPLSYEEATEKVKAAMAEKARKAV